MTDPYWQDDMLTLHHGDAAEVAKSIPSKSVQTIVTSPPYFGLRDYGTAGEIGSEKTPEEFVANIVHLFACLRWALADDGTLWLNLGDSYGKRKQLLGIPWMVAHALQADGWVLRSEVIWQKPNPMPESVTDRPTRSHETVFMFAKSQDYFYDAAAVAEPAKDWSTGGPGTGIAATTHYGAGNGGNSGLSKIAARYKSGNGPTTRNRRSVWTIPTIPLGGAHFAVYPPDLIRPCILAGSRPGDTVLDPFSGSGTTGMVALQEGRRYVGIDLNREYLDLSLRTRFESPPLNMEGIDT